jgi:hypothetical protein
MASLDVDPVQGALDGLLPARVPLLALGVVPLRGPALVLVPVGLELVGVAPEADGEARPA